MTTYPNKMDLVACPEASLTISSELLAQHGAKCEQRDRFGHTPLHMAKSVGSAGEDVFQFLLQRILCKKTSTHQCRNCRLPVADSLIS